MLFFGKRNYARIVRVMACFLSVALLLCACAEIPQKQGETVTITDALGRRVDVPRSPARTAALQGSLADLFLLAGGTLCAAASDAWEDLSLPLGDAVSVGGAHSPSLEAILAANPALVIASAAIPAHVALADPLSHVGIAVLYFDIVSFEDYLSALETLTVITGRADLYQQNGIAVKNAVDRVKSAYADASLDAVQRKVLLLRVGAGKIKAKGSVGTVLGEMLLDIGCQNIADADGTLLDTLSAEAVLQNEPYHIFVVCMGADMQAAHASLSELISENPAWGALTAVKEGRLHFMEKSLFHLKPNARWGEAYEILAKTLMGE